MPRVCATTLVCLFAATAAAEPLPPDPPPLPPPRLPLVPAPGEQESPVAAPEEPKQERPFSAGAGGPHLIGIQALGGASLGMLLADVVVRPPALILAAGLAGAGLFAFPTAVFQHHVPVSVACAYLAFFGAAAGYGLAGGAWATFDQRLTPEARWTGILAVTAGFQVGFFAMVLPPGGDAITWWDVVALVACAGLPPLAATLFHHAQFGPPRDLRFLTAVSVWPLAVLAIGRTWIALARGGETRAPASAALKVTAAPLLMPTARGTAPGLAVAASF